MATQDGCKCRYNTNIAPFITPQHALNKIPMPSIPSLKTYVDLNDWNQHFLCEFIRYSTSIWHLHFSEPDNLFTLSSKLPTCMYWVLHSKQRLFFIINSHESKSRTQLDPCPSVPPQIDQHKECPKNRAHTSTKPTNNSSKNPQPPKPSSPQHHQSRLRTYDTWSSRLISCLMGTDKPAAEAQKETEQIKASVWKSEAEIWNANGMRPIRLARCELVVV